MVRNVTMHSDLPYQVKKYNRTSITMQDFNEWIQMFTRNFFNDSGFKMLSKNIDVNVLENYMKMLVDKKLSLRFLKPKEVQKMKRIYSEISCFKQSTFPLILNKPELKYILKKLFKEETVAKVFRDHKMINQDLEKYYEVLKILKEICFSNKLPK